MSWVARVLVVHLMQQGLKRRTETIRSSYRLLSRQSVISRTAFCSASLNCQSSLGFALVKSSVLIKNFIKAGQKQKKYDMVELSRSGRVVSCIIRM